MIPRTCHQKSAFDVMSAMQKYVRRCQEADAMLCVLELGNSSKAMFTMAANRLEVISHEDIGLADPEAVLFAGRAIDQARRFYDDKKPGKWRMMLGNAVRTLCRAEKSREGDHFQCAMSARLEAEDGPVIPDWIHDMHTYRGKRLGRGIDYFRLISAKLVPEPRAKDSYEEAAYVEWKRREQSPKQEQEVKKPKPDDPQGVLPLK